MVKQKNKTKNKKTRIVAVTFDKGGATKTTTAVHLAHGLARLGNKVLLIDTDPQSLVGNVAMHLGLTQEDVPKSLHDFIVNGDTSAIYETREDLFVIRGGFPLNLLRSSIASRQLGREVVYQEALEQIKHIFDFIIFDTPPSFDDLNLNALFCADEIIIPLNLTPMTVDSLEGYINNNITQVQKYRKKNPLEWGYALPTMFDRRTKDGENLIKRISEFFNSTLTLNPDFESQYTNTVVLEPIRRNIAVERAAGHGQTVYEFAPNSPGALDYTNFTRIFEQGIHLKSRSAKSNVK